MKQIPSAPGYFADDSGHIWRKGHRLRSRSNGHGYLRIKLSISGITSDAYVHRLVCEAYNGPCPDGLQCRHLNGIRDDNRPSNLVWSDKLTNEADKIVHGTINRGERHGAATLTNAQVIEARQRAAAGEKPRDLAKRMGVRWRTLTAAITGRRYSYVPGALPLYSTRRRNSLGRWE